jgi:hypothetical protein
LRDYVDAPIPAFTGSCPIPHPNWGYSVAQMDLRKLQPLVEAAQGLLQRGLMVVEILQTFFSRGVKPLHRREVNTRMLPLPSCPDCPFFAELGNIGINTQIRGVLSSGGDPNFGPNPVPLRERVDNLCVCLLGLAFSYLCQSPFPNISTPMQGLRCACNTPWGVSLPEDVTRQEARHVCSERLWARRQRR